MGAQGCTASPATARPHGPGNASIGGTDRVLPDFGTPLQHISPHQRGLSMLETPWWPLPAHLTTATGHNPLLPSQCLKRGKALWCVPAGLRNAWKQWQIEQRFSVLASIEAPWPQQWKGASPCSPSAQGPPHPSGAAAAPAQPGLKGHGAGAQQEQGCKTAGVAVQCQP